MRQFVKQLRPRNETYTPPVDKIQDFLFESKLKAEDYEAAIVMGWHENNGVKFNLSASGISPKVYKTVKNNPVAMESGKLIAKKIANHFRNPSAKAEQYGRAKSKLTSFWKSFGATDTTPKTDILIVNVRW